MKSTRRMLALVLCLVLCLALLPASASAANLLASGWANAGRTASFKLYTDGRMEVSGTGTIGPMTTWSFTSGFDGGYLSQNDAIAATRSAMKSLKVEEGISQIGPNAFRECPNLVTVDLPLSLTDGGAVPAIAQSAFEDCKSLDDVYIPNNVGTIDTSAFRGCTGLRTLYLSDGLTTINASAFENCVSLTEVTIPANVGQIGGLAFNNCNSLSNVYFLGNYPTMDNTAANGSFRNVTATAYYPVDNNSWNQNLPNIMNMGGADFGGRLTWKPSTAYTDSNGWVQKGNDWYYYMSGIMVRNNWVAYEGRWFYFGENGRMMVGRQKIGDKYYYFGQGAGIDNLDLGARYSGWIQDPDDGNNYFYDDNGIWQPGYSGVNDTGLNLFQNGWQVVNGKWFYIKNQAKVTGWLKWKDRWYYLDPTSGAMVTGWLDWNGKTYYLRPLDVANRDGQPEGSMVSGRSETIGGTVYTFDSDGALKGGKMEDNPLGLATGFRQVSANPRIINFIRSDGSMAKDKWELVDSNWYYFDKNGNLKTGWLKWEGNWYYLDPNSAPIGRMVTGIQTIATTKDGINTQKTYFFKSNGALNGKGWIKQNNKWYYLNEDGILMTGWLREGNKWYYLDDGTSPRPNGSGNFNYGEMVTGVFNVPNNGVNNPFGQQSFKANGEWIGAGASAGAGTAGGWAQDGSGRWFWKDTDGVAVTGWQEIGGKWYYLSPTSSPAGAMVTGFQDIGGQRFYFDGSGAMQSGWQHLDGVWYFFNPNHDGNFGAMRTGWQQINKNWYYLAETGNVGAMQIGWIENPAGSNTWYYLNSAAEGTEGAMHGGGWMKVGDKWYYMNPEHDGTYGRQLQGWQQVGGIWYYMRESVNPAEGWMVTGRQQLEWNGVTNWYYFDGNGHMVKNTTIDGHHYGGDGAETS